MIEQIKSRLSINDILTMCGLKPNSSGFIYSIYNQNEKTPSMKIYPKSNSFYCFSSCTGGDQIKLYADFYKIEMKQAIRELADICGLSQTSFPTVTQLKRKPIETPRETEIFTFADESEKDFYIERAGIIELDGGMDRKTAERLAVQEIRQRRKEIRIKIYESLYSFCSEKGFSAEAMKYLTGKKRNLKPETLQNFRVFNIHSVSDTIKFLKKNFSFYELQISGLFSQRNYFMFSFHKIVIPYIENEKISYLRGRYFDNNNSDIPGDSFGKYIGLSNTFGGLSSKRLFNIDCIKQLPANNDLFLVEGEYDGMILSQNGYNAVAVGGVGNFSPDFVPLLSNYKLHLCFDYDEAGEKAIKEISKQFDIPLKQVKLKTVKDITELEAL